MGGATNEAANRSSRTASDPLIDTARLQLENVHTVYSPEASAPGIFALDYAIE
jgi:hypothetical protein